MQHQSFWKHGQLGRAEFILAVMADDEMFEHRLQRLRKARDERNLGLQHFQLNHHMSEKLALGRVGERAVVGKLVNLADVVKKGASKQKIAIDLRIVFAGQIAGAEQRDHVIEQAADVSVMQALGRGSAAISRRDFRIVHEGLQQGFQMSVLKGSDESGQCLPEFVDVLRGLGKIIGEVDF